MRVKVSKIRKKKYDVDEINYKHNLWRIKNDLNWIFKNQQQEDNIKTTLCLYWLDINFKNTFFPWILKIERELKSSFICFYKWKFNSDNAIELGVKENYTDISNKKNPLKIFDEIDLSSKSIDEVVFTLTFGEFVNLLIFFNDSIKTKIANELGMKLPIFINVIKFFIILRNAVAHNKTIIKIRDEKNNKRFSLKKDFFEFDIPKNHVDVLSTNASGCIYVVKHFLKKIDSDKKAKFFINDIKKNLKLFYKTMNNKKEYERIIKLIFLEYLDDILKI